MPNETKNNYYIFMHIGHCLVPRWYVPLLPLSSETRKQRYVLLATLELESFGRLAAYLGQAYKELNFKPN